jgi:hypothetical protein
MPTNGGIPCSNMMMAQLMGLSYLQSIFVGKKNDGRSKDIPEVLKDGVCLWWATATTRYDV